MPRFPHISSHWQIVIVELASVRSSRSQDDVQTMVTLRRAEF